MTHIPEIIKKAALEERARLVSERDRVALPINKQIADIDQFLAEHGTPVTPAPVMPAVPVLRIDSDSESEASISRQIRDTAKALILPGRNATTELIHQTMLASGIRFPLTGKPPMSRITRVLSGTGLYKGHKTHGWSLKGESPAVTGLSSATMSEQDEL